MKLHLPCKLLSALLACFCVAATTAWANSTVTLEGSAESGYTIKSTLDDAGTNTYTASGVQSASSAELDSLKSKGGSVILQTDSAVEGSKLTITDGDGLLSGLGSSVWWSSDVSTLNSDLTLKDGVTVDVGGAKLGNTTITVEKGAELKVSGLWGATGAASALNIDGGKVSIAENGYSLASTMLTDGTLIAKKSWSSSTALTVSGASTITVESGQTMTLDGSVISDANSTLTVDGAGILSLGGTLTNAAGTINVTTGTLQVAEGYAGAINISKDGAYMVSGTQGRNADLTNAIPSTITFAEGASLAVALETGYSGADNGIKLADDFSGSLKVTAGTLSFMSQLGNASQVELANGSVLMFHDAPAFKGGEWGQNNNKGTLTTVFGAMGSRDTDNNPVSVEDVTSGKTLVVNTNALIRAFGDANASNDNYISKLTGTGTLTVNSGEGDDSFGGKITIVDMTEFSGQLKVANGTFKAQKAKDVDLRQGTLTITGSNTKAEGTGSIKLTNSDANTHTKVVFDTKGDYYIDSFALSREWGSDGLKNTLEVASGTTLHVLGTASTQKDGSMSLSTWGGDNHVVIKGTLEANAYLSNNDGSGNVDVESGGELVMKAGLGLAAIGEDKGWGNVSLNVKAGGTLTMADTAAFTTRHLTVNIENGATLAADGTATVGYAFGLTDKSVNLKATTSNKLTYTADVTGATKLTATGGGTVELTNATGFTGTLATNGTIVALAGGTSADDMKTYTLAALEHTGGEGTWKFGDYSNVTISSTAARANASGNSPHIEVGTGSTVTDNAQWQLTNAKLTVKGTGTYEVAGIVLGAGDVQGNLDVAAGTTLHVTGASTDATGTNGSFMLSNGAVTSFADVSGKLILESGLSSGNGTGSINVKNGGTLQMNNGLSYARREGVEGKTDSVNVASGGTLALATSADQGEKLKVNLGDGATVAAVGEIATIGTTFTYASGANVNMKAEADKKLVLTSSVAGATQITAIGGGTVALQNAVIGTEPTAPVVDGDTTGTGTAYTVKEGTTLSIGSSDATALEFKQSTAGTNATISAAGVTSNMTVTANAGSELAAGNYLTIGSDSTLVLNYTGEQTPLTLGGSLVLAEGATLDVTKLGINTEVTTDTTYTLFNVAAGGSIVSGPINIKVSDTQTLTNITLNESGALVIDAPDAPPALTEGTVTGTIVTAATTYADGVLTFQTNLTQDALQTTIELTYDTAYELADIMGDAFTSVDGVSVALTDANGNALTLAGVNSLVLNGYDGFAGSIENDFSSSAVYDAGTNTFGKYYAPSIPEPTTATLSLLALAALAARRRRK